MQGSALDPARKQAVAEKLHQYTGLPVAYLLKADLRVTGGMFEHELQADGDITTGRLDSRFAGPSLDPLSKTSEYDPQSSAISSAYVAAFNDYVRKQLKFGQDMRYRLYADIDHWDFSHKAPGVDGEALQSSTNVMPDLAMAMKTNPDLKVFLNGGYYDLATPYFAAEYEMNHLPIPDSLRKNITYPVVPVRPHGLRPPGLAEAAARQRGPLHRADRQREVMGAASGVPGTTMPAPSRPGCRHACRAALRYERDSSTIDASPARRIAPHAQP